MNHSSQLDATDPLASLSEVIFPFGDHRLHAINSVLYLVEFVCAFVYSRSCTYAGTEGSISHEFPFSTEKEAKSDTIGKSLQSFGPEIAQKVVKGLSFLCVLFFIES